MHCLYCALDSVLLNKMWHKSVNCLRYVMWLQLSSHLLRIDCIILWDVNLIIQYIIFVDTLV